MAESSADFKTYEAYFCHASADTKWVMDLINKLESRKYGIKCAEFDRDFSCVGKYITDLFQEFLVYSHWITVVLSPEFVQSKWSMYQLNLAVDYSINKDHANIVPLLKTSVDVPDCLTCFELVDTREKQWFELLVHRMNFPATMFPKFKPVCTKKDHISINALAGPSMRDRSNSTKLRSGSTSTKIRYCFESKISGQKDNTPYRSKRCKHQTHLSLNYICSWVIFFQSFWDKAKRDGFRRSGSSATHNNRQSRDRKGEEGVTYAEDDPDKIPDVVLDNGSHSKGLRLRKEIRKQRTYAIPDCVLDSGRHSKALRLSNGTGKQRIDADSLLT